MFLFKDFLFVSEKSDLVQLLVYFNLHQKNLFFDSHKIMDFLLGTDALGRDMLSRLIYGARISLFIGLSVMVVSVIAGIALGLIAAYLGGAVDAVARSINQALQLYQQSVSIRRVQPGGRLV